jgi:hypothetical protein
VSSDYQIICLSHDPAIIVEQDYTNAEQALNDAGDHYAHPDCDLIVGKWSGGLVELCCPGMPEGRKIRDHTWLHSGDQWVKAAWLRLALLAGAATTEAARIPGCWTYLRLHKLRYILGIEERP